jgi:mevalonate kinase
MVHPNLSDSSTLNSIVLEVPAKAMLFGEYGVLHGGGAVAALLPSHCFRIEFQLSDEIHSSDSGVEVESRFFNESVWLPSAMIQNFSLLPKDSESRKISCYVSGFADQLKKRKLKVRVLGSFSSSLGFGSSSALIVAFQKALAHFFGAMNGVSSSRSDIADPEKLYQALLDLQGKGSGYDVAVQSWAVEQKKLLSPAVTFFRNKAFAERRFAPEVSEIDIPPSELKRLGCLVRTGVTSDTTRVLKSTAALQNNIDFCAAQSLFAEQFRNSPTAENAIDLCRKSALTAQQTGLLPSTPDITRFVRTCDHENIAWKTMGAGHGDCLWVLAPEVRVAEIIREIKAESLSVSFAFAGKE